MILRQNESPWTVPAPAKLNLSLDVLGRRSDGYHELETLMVPVQIYDSLAFSANSVAGDDRSDAISFGFTLQLPAPAGKISEASIPAGRENLVVRALELLRERSGCRLGAHVHLVKRIPAGAGMGGGSSDAAAALRLGNRGWGINWGLERLTGLAAELGSDVPFFLSSGPAICRGRGEQVARVSPIGQLHFVVVVPPDGLSTADVYHCYGERAECDQNGSELGRERLMQLVAAIRRGNLSTVGQRMGNRLQAAAARLTPWIDRIKAACAGLDFLGHQLTGSGSAYFGVCRHAQHARRLATILRTRQLGLVFVTQSCR